MKKVIILLTFLISSYVHAQTELDSLLQVQVQTQAQLDLLIDNLDNHHTQYRNGMIMCVAGVGLVALAGPNLEISIPGAIISLIGSIFVWDSDKWFAKKRQKKSRDLAIIPTNNVGQFENNLKRISVGDKVFRVGDRVYYTGGFRKKEATLKDITFNDGNYLFVIKFKKNNKEIECSSSFLKTLTK